MAGCRPWCEMSQKNKMQTNTLLGGIMTLLLGGTFVGSSIFNIHLCNQTWTLNYSSSMVLTVICLFHVAAVLGSFLGVILVERIEKLILSRIYLFLMGVASILKVIVPTSMYGIMFSRIIAGFAYGLAYLVVLIHGGEVVVKELRGTTIAFVNYVVFLGILVHAAVSPVAISDYTGEPSRILGIAGIMFSLMAALIGQFMSYESPVFLIRKGRDAEAVRSLIKLRLESTETMTVQQEYIDLRKMVEEDEVSSWSIFSDGNWRPLVLISLGKIAAVLSFNAAVNQVRMVVVDELLGLDTFSVSGIVIISIRIVLGVAFLFTIDRCGRKPTQALSAFFSGFMLTTMGGIYMQLSCVSIPVASGVFLVYELAASTGVHLVPDVHLSEGFSTKKKALSIAVIQLVEHAAHIAIVSVTFTWNFANPDIYGAILLFCGIPLMVIAILLHVFLPETTKLTLRKSRAAFARVDSLYGTNKELQYMYN